jgi:homoserine acetyltransferase
MGTVEHIHIASEAAKPMVALAEARIIVGQGIEGDRYANKSGRYSDYPGAGRHVTFRELVSPYGHDAFLKEDDQFTAIIDSLLHASREEFPHVQV